ncbi:MAG TPA: hypothetical protein EYP92_02380 [Candidatus Thioglobus sp.]|jgi:hypothetical protein|nr:hypothetical protein [Candidatus Thioglobus sp.]HIL42964.1 hypothetical protein [Gammaproteobacteria bacterium]
MCKLPEVSKLNKQEFIVGITTSWCLINTQRLIAKNATLSAFAYRFEVSDSIFCNDLIHIDTIPQINYVDSVGAGTAKVLAILKSYKSLGFMILRLC